MTKYKIQVVETRNYDVEYIVDADSEEEALRKAEIGDTINETDSGKMPAVIDRFVMSDDLVRIDEK